MATCMLEAAVMLLKFIWITSQADAGLILPNCTVSVSQPQYIEADATSSSVTIPCTFSMDGCFPDSDTFRITLWFRYFSHSHEDLCTPFCANRAKFGNKESSLQIKDIGAGDIAVYFCGVVIQNRHGPGSSKQVGGGTTLMLRGTEKYKQRINIMMAISVLLLLYLIAMLIILKFLSKPKVKNTEQGGLKAHRPCSKEKREAVGRAIAQELCKKKPGRCKRTGHLDKALQKRSQPIC